MALLTVEELRQRISTTLDDEALEGMLEAAELEINRRAGPIARAEFIVGGHSTVMIARRPGTLDAVIEYVGDVTTILDASDFELEPGSNVVRRLLGGTNPSQRFRGQVEIRYTVDDTALRKEVQAELVRLDITAGSGGSGAITQQRIGEWSESYSNNPNVGSELRADILSRLDENLLVFWTPSGDRQVASAVLGS